MMIVDLETGKLHEGQLSLIRMLDDGSVTLSDGNVMIRFYNDEAIDIVDVLNISRDEEK